MITQLWKLLQRSLHLAINALKPILKIDDITDMNVNAIWDSKEDQSANIRVQHRVTEDTAKTANSKWTISGHKSSDITVDHRYGDDSQVIVKESWNDKFDA